MTLSPIAKAIVAALIAALGVIGAGLTDGNLEAAEWVASAVAGLVALGGVYQVRNTPKDA